METNEIRRKLKTLPLNDLHALRERWGKILKADRSYNPEAINNRGDAKDWIKEIDACFSKLENKGARFKKLSLDDLNKLKNHWSTVYRDNKSYSDESIRIRAEASDWIKLIDDRTNDFLIEPVRIINGDKDKLRKMIKNIIDTDLKGVVKKKQTMNGTNKDKIRSIMKSRHGIELPDNELRSYLSKLGYTKPRKE